MIRLRGDGTYRDPGGLDPKKSRSGREKELMQLADSQDGRDIIIALWKEAKGIQPGTIPLGMIGALVKQEMIPDIPAHEYPNG
jgi:hypothetical protein